MKRKNFILFFMLMLLLPASAWADKYYKARYAPSQRYRVSTLEVGKKYMIFNTAFNGDEDRTGFLYNDGTGLALDKSRDNDQLIYNECFVFTLEKGAGEYQYYIKSLASNTYIDVTGSASNPTTSNASLQIIPWDVAANGDTFDKKTGNFTDNNVYKQAPVNSMNEYYTTVHYTEITSAGNKVFIISNDDYNNYWNGTVTAFDDEENGHPFAFYEVVEVQNVDGFDVKDLHMYSRCDIYSAQKIYGYVQDALLITTNKPFNDEGAIANLLDGDNTSYNVTNREDDANTDGAKHYYQIDLGKEVGSLYLYMQRSANGSDIPTVIDVQVCATANGEFTSIGSTYETGLSSSVAYQSPVINLGGSYQYIRIVANESNGTNGCMALSELYVLPNIDVITNAFEYFVNSMPVSATEREFMQILERYNNEASAVKLLSGVPMPGNKYRIYADAFAGGVYVNRDISTDGASLSASGSYNSAGDKTPFEWYCEKTTDGKLVFRNVKYPTYYLSNAGVTTDINNAKWTINTNQTQRHGVPLINNAGQYLTVYNTGEHWQGNVMRVQNQTITTGTVDINNTADDTTDDVDVTALGGFCTDFVFLPVEVSGTEKRITIISDVLADRNSTLTYDGGEYDIPFSMIFADDSKLPLLVSTANKHTFDGFYNRRTGANIGTEIDADIYSDLQSGDTLEAIFTIVEPFEKVEEDGPMHIYRIKNMRALGAAQQSPIYRSNINIEGSGDGDEPVSPSSGVEYYASFNNRDANLNLVEASEAIDASMFFYFTGGEITNNYYSAFIHSAITPKKCKNAAAWDDAGQIYFIQPNTSGGNVGAYSGYTIARTALGESNNPADAWCSNHENGDIVIDNSAEDDGAEWIFEKVDDAVAKTALNDYIVALADAIRTELTALKEDSPEEKGLDVAKIDAYIQAATDYTAVNENLQSYVANAQALHMLHHEIEYALQALPQVTDESAFAETGFEPHWYYVKNVYGSSYATYAGVNNNMQLMSKAPDYSDMNLYNLFYFAGEKVNPGATNEYLDVHIHNLMAADSTLIGQNEVIFEDVTLEGSGTDHEQVNIQPVSATGAWEITAEFNSNGNSMNHYGSCLLATGTSATNSTYADGFQVYLQTDGDLVIKAGDSGNFDTYCFDHVRGAYSYIKVVLSYADYKLKVSVTNSQGSTKTIKDIENINRDYIPCPQMADIEKMCTNMPVGVKIASLSAENVLAMKWGKHNPEDLEHDKWFVLPSSNTNYPGLAIVMESADDENMGWTNVAGENNEIFTDLGNFDYSTWQLEKVEDFELHMEQLLELWNVDECLVYNKELVELYRAIYAIYDECKASGVFPEDKFNDMVEFVNTYCAKGKDVSAYLQPQAGKLYTIRPIADEYAAEALAVHVDMAESVVGDGPNDVVRTIVKDKETGEYMSRGVWSFEPTATENVYKVKSLHTLMYFTSLGDGTVTEGVKNSTKLTADGAEVTLEPLGGSSTYFLIGGKYMDVNGNIAANGGTNETKWFIEEINPDSVYHKTATNSNGHSTLMLGFPAKIPAEVEAFYARTHGDILQDRYLSMTSYDGGILPANTPVVLRNADFESEGIKTIENLKFYYSSKTIEAVEDNYLYGSLYHTLVDCASFDGKDIDGDGVGEADVKIYMLQKNNDEVRMFWIYENYSFSGENTGNNDDGGYVMCHANKAYMVLPSDLTKLASLVFRFPGGTTDIEEVVSECNAEEVRAVYDLQGRVIDEITAPGVYIVNGKKVVVK